MRCNEFGECRQMMCLLARILNRGPQVAPEYLRGTAIPLAASPSSSCAIYPAAWPTASRICLYRLMCSQNLCCPDYETACGRGVLLKLTTHKFLPFHRAATHY